MKTSNNQSKIQSIKKYHNNSTSNKEITSKISNQCENNDHTDTKTDLELGTNKNGGTSKKISLRRASGTAKLNIDTYFREIET